MITRTIARKAILNNEEYSSQQEIMRQLKWKWEKPINPMALDEWKIIDITTNQEPNVRTELLEHFRKISPLTGIGKLDYDYKWHDITLNFWKNPSLNYFQQRLCFSNLHKANRLSDIGKPTINCKLCKVPATWEHVFFDCSKANYEREIFHRKWDNMNIGKIRIDKLRIHNRKTLQFYPNGIVYYSNFKSWSNKKLEKEKINEIYKIFASYIENCYKNSDWNTIHAKERGYNPNPNFPTNWQSKNNL